ncbi:MAG: SGNH/GDSL hydrolase family protein [Oscillospiraceae bacterium]|nr:SGNH/GDSL hydrolase family protein [Oscillospiraceae bacterium]
MKKKLTAMLLAAGMLLTGCADKTESSVQESSAAETTAAATTTEPESNRKRMVILGDSISAGYGLDDTDSERYGVLLREKLNEDAGAMLWEENNYAISGDDSSDLLYRLEVGRAVRLPSADIIIICIGANNMLGAYTDYAQELLGDRDIESLAEMEESELDALEQELIEQVENDTEAEAKLEAAIDKGLEQLKSDLEEIYSYIRERNETAEIYVMNVYNPYEGMTDPLPMLEQPAGDFAQEKIDRCNAILADWEQAHPDLHAVDLAAAFSGWNPKPIIGSAGAEGAGEAYLDPHPNADGHKKIADLLYNSITKAE